MNTYLYREKKIKSLFSKKTNTFRASLEKNSFDVGTLPVPFLKSRASKEVMSRWPVSSGQQSARVHLSLLVSNNSPGSLLLTNRWSKSLRTLGTPTSVSMGACVPIHDVSTRNSLHPLSQSVRWLNHKAFALFLRPLFIWTGTANIRDWGRNKSLLNP